MAYQVLFFSYCFVVIKYLYSNMTVLDFERTGHESKNMSIHVLQVLDFFFDTLYINDLEEHSHC